MRFELKTGRLALAILVILSLGSVACGRKDTPLPPPPPQVNNGPTGGFYGGGGNCGGLPAGIPFNQNNTPYNGSLQSYYGGGYSSSSNINLTLAYAQGYSGSYQTNNVVAVSQLIIPEVSYQPICASSVDPTTGVTNYGMSQGPYISMSLSGVAQMMNPYMPYGFPGQQQQFIQSPVYVDIQGYLQDNRIQGEVGVTIGSEYFSYQAY